MKTIAQLSYIPLSAEDPRESVQELLEHLAQYDLQIEVGYLSSTIIGETDEIFKVIRELYDTMKLESPHFRFHIELLSMVEE